MDEIFGEENFRNQISWHRQTPREKKATHASCCSARILSFFVEKDMGEEMREAVFGIKSLPKPIMSPFKMPKKSISMIRGIFHNIRPRCILKPISAISAISAQRRSNARRAKLAVKIIDMLGEETIIVK